MLAVLLLTLGLLADQELLQRPTLGPATIPLPFRSPGPESLQLPVATIQTGAAGELFFNMISVAVDVYSPIRPDRYRVLVNGIEQGGNFAIVLGSEFTHPATGERWIRLKVQTGIFMSVGVRRLAVRVNWKTHSPDFVVCGRDIDCTDKTTNEVVLTVGNLTIPAPTTVPGNVTKVVR